MVNREPTRTTPLLELRRVVEASPEGCTESAWQLAQADWWLVNAGVGWTHTWDAGRFFRVGARDGWTLIDVGGRDAALANIDRIFAGHPAPAPRW